MIKLTDVGKAFGDHWAVKGLNTEYEKLTGREFLNFMAVLYRIDSARADQQIKELSSKFSIEQYLDDLIENYSAGMKQRLVFASALLHDPKVLLIDEPIIGLDPKGIRMLKKLLEEFARSGVAIFMATHSLLLAEELCSTIGILNKGQLIAMDKKDNLLSGARGLEEFFLEITESPAP